MADANRAYEEGDQERLQKILDEWESSPESIRGEDIGTELVRILRKIAQAEGRLGHITTEIKELLESDLYQLKMKAEESEARGQNLLAKMAARLNDEISRAQKQLEGFVQKK